MTLDELVRAILDRGGDVVLRDGRIRYYGPTLAPDDPIRAGVREHRGALIAMLSPVPPAQPVAVFVPGPPYFEQIGPNTWIETTWARARCVYGDAGLAPGDPLRCRMHADERRRELDDELADRRAAAAVANGSADPSPYKQIDFAREHEPPESLGRIVLTGSAERVPRGSAMP